MKKFISLWAMAYLILLLVSSCHTVRKKIERDEQSRFQYAQTAFISDSAVRYWYFYSDSAFSYHPDSGLHTPSGRLLGWEVNVNHKLEQYTLDSASRLQHDETEVTRDKRRIWSLGYTVFIFLGAILVVVFFNDNLHRN